MTGADAQRRRDCVQGLFQLELLLQRQSQLISPREFPGFQPDGAPIVERRLHQIFS